MDSDTQVVTDTMAPSLPLSILPHSSVPAPLLSSLRHPLPYVLIVSGVERQ